MLYFGAFLSILAGACVVFDQMGQWMWDKGWVRPLVVRGFRVHHRYVYLFIPLFAVAANI